MKKIMFNDKYSLTEAVLNGSKTQTRRICKYDRPSNDWEIVFPCFGSKDYDNDGKCISPLDGAFGWHNTKTGEELKWNIPKYKVEEVVAVAQSYKDCGEFDVYEAPKETAGWNNKMFVKAECMPHRIRISSVKIEKLQGISNEDCLNEGITKSYHKDINGEWGRYYWHHGITRSNCPNGQYKEYSNPREAFISLIDSVSGKGTWDSNPFVWVYEFELVI